MKIIAYALYGLWALSFWAWAAYMLDRKYGHGLCAAILSGLCYAAARVVLGVWA